MSVQEYTEPTAGMKLNQGIHTGGLVEIIINNLFMFISYLSIRVYIPTYLYIYVSIYLSILLSLFELSAQLLSPSH